MLLKFFRKHQRFFFLIVTVVIVISFSFFGTFSTFLNTEEVQDQVIGKAIDGSSLYKREVEDLSRFLSTSVQDAPLLNHGKLANLFNDDVVKKDFLQTGMGGILAEKFFEELRPELEEKVEKIKRYVPYSHPSAPFLSAETLWQQFSPQTHQLMSFLRAKESVDPQFFALLSTLSVQQPNPEMMRRILLMQQSQYPGMRPDETLYSANLHPFGFETWEEWFGPRYLQLISQFILNAAKLAEKKGYSVSMQEVRADLSRHLQEGLKIIRPQANLAYEDVRDYFIHQLRMLGMDENRVVKLWQKVMLFRMLFTEVGNFALLDPLTFEAWGNYVNEAAEVEQYELPEELCLKDFRSLLKLQLYLEGAGGLAPAELLLPEKLLSVQDVEKRAPELVQRAATIEWKEVNKEEISQRITLKETWQWEGQDAGWQILQAKFPKLAKETTNTPEGRWALLDQLDPQERLKIDRLARLQILEGHPEWIEEAFERQEARKEATSIRLKGSVLPFSCPLDGAALLAEMEKQSVLTFTSEEGVISRLRVENLSPHAELISFKVASRDGALDAALDKRLEEAYPDVRKKNSALFTSDDGKWKSFQEVRDHVGAYLYAPLMKAIEESWKAEGNSLPQNEGFQPLEFYTSHRLYAWMKKQQKAVQLAQEKEQEWKLEKHTRTLKRGEKSVFAKQELFSLVDGAWSKVSVGDRGEISFCRMLKRHAESSLPPQEMAQAKAALSREACRKLAEDLLGQMVQKKAIGMTLPSETRR